MGNDTGLCELPRNRNAEKDIRMWPWVNIRQIVSIGIVGKDHGVVTPLQTNSQNFSGPGREIGRFCVNVCTNVSFKHIDLWRICIGLVIQRELCPYLCQVTVVCHGDSKIQCHTMKAFFVQLSQVRLEITVPVACLKSGPELHYSLTPAVNRSVRPRVKMFSWLRNR